jgi:hypothetical protein
MMGLLSSWRRDQLSLRRGQSVFNEAIPEQIFSRSSLSTLGNAPTLFPETKGARFMRRLRIWIPAFLFLAAAGAAPGMPMFARKYKLECAYCHTVIPKLTEAGFQFRAAGWREPGEIGSREKEKFNFNIGDYDSFRTQFRYDLSRTDNAGVVSTTNQLTHFELTLYPLTGAFYGNYSSMFEISLAAGDSPEAENAYGRGNWKLGPGHLSARLGIFHPFEGYGASDRPLGISRPLIQTAGGNFNQPTFFTPWTSPTTGGSFDQAGLELGYTVNRSSIRATILNGLSFSTDEGTLVPATGLSGADSKVKGRTGYNSKDLQLFFTQLLTDNGGGVSLYYYNGVDALPVVGSNNATFFKNGFQRYAAYASYPVGPVLLLGGYQQGKDDTFTSAAGYGPRNKLKGYFGEADFLGPNLLGVAARYDNFDPSDRKSGDKQARYTVAVNKAMGNGLQAIAEYGYKKTEQGTRGDRKDSAFQVRLIWIW